jgi:hypothetical protein
MDCCVITSGSPVLFTAFTGNWRNLRNRSRYLKAAIHVTKFGMNDDSAPGHGCQYVRT